ncbi:hypothetical protein BB561_000756 [Smittium simulii]|uniref:methylated diphthine methylhydrolase n=1 Tax=Smittium simulii TaxID=133385 RepID=A0A2T9YXP0_9FUNG|nr:hypothetical protein BB561_000756 [Smittium simulii]
MAATIPEPSYSCKLPYTADCVESFPYKLDDQQLGASILDNNAINYQLEDFGGRFILGMYQLKKSQDKDTRVGQLIVADYFQKKLQKTGELIKRQIIETVGVFDIKWSYNLVNGHQLLGQAGSDGKLAIYNTTKSEDSWLDKVVESGSFGEDNMCLSLDWSNRIHKEENVKIACSYSDGSINVFQLDNQSTLNSICSTKAHGFEAWIVAFDYHNTDTIYSGGDDGLFKRWDIRENGYNHCNFTSKRHGAGVCSIQSNPHKENILASGSYDEMVYIWDNRNMKSPMLEYYAGGGVWRLKWNQNDTDKLLVAAMHNGVDVVNINGLKEASNGDYGSDLTVQQLSHFDKHESMAYGADWGYSFNNSLDDNLIGRRTMMALVHRH